MYIKASLFFHPCGLIPNPWKQLFPTLLAISFDICFHTFKEQAYAAAS